MLVCRMDRNCEDLVIAEAFLEFGWTETGVILTHWCLPYHLVSVFGLCALVLRLGLGLGSGSGIGLGLV